MFGGASDLFGKDCRLACYIKDKKEKKQRIEFVKMRMKIAFMPFIYRLPVDISSSF